jgi:hypothetical protein
MTLNVLFIGNSFTARNDLPAMIANLAASRGITLQHRLISAGGASLRRHWNAGTAATAIRAGSYDCVVLQEQSTLPIKNPHRMHENVRLFDEEIKRAGSRTALYLTWARRAAALAAQEQITEAYLTIGKELGATVVPVGVARQAVLGEHDCPLLHDRDGSHPTPAGSYLAACAFVAALLGQNPVGLEGAVAGIGDAERLQLQQAAWRAVQMRRPARG